jgi:hypothetical protein
MTGLNEISMFLPLKEILSTLRMAMSLDKSQESHPGWTKASPVVVSRWPSSDGFLTSWAPMMTWSQFCYAYLVFICDSENKIS